MDEEERKEQEKIDKEKTIKRKVFLKQKRNEYDNKHNFRSDIKL